MEDDAPKLTKKEKRELAKEKKQEERQSVEKQGSFKRFMVVAVIVGLLGFIGYKFWQIINTPTQTSGEPIQISEDDWVKGSRDAKAVLIEYGDFECPACAIYYPETKKLAEEFGNRIAVIYRHYPLIQIHKNALTAAWAAEAAGGMGKFWEMHDILYEKQEEWSKSGSTEEMFLAYAKELGLSEEEFKTRLASQEVKDSVNKDIVSGNQLRVQGTPTYYLNGRKIQPRGYDDFKAQIEQVLEQQ